MTSPEKAEKTKRRNKPKAPRLKRRREAPPADTRLAGAAACVDASGQGTLTRVVGIGASAGGLEALKRFFSAMPADSGLAFVLILHLDPVHKSFVAELLSKHTGMIVRQVQEDTPVEANHVYVLSPNNYLSISGRVLRLSAPTERRGLRMPVDFLFRSLAADLQEAAVGIILSGTGSDGALGLKEIKAAGGMAMVQDPDTAEHDGMPRSAIAAGGVDYLLPVEKMPEELLNYLRHMDEAHQLEGEAGDYLGQIVALLHAHAKFNFSCYKKGTLGRRIRRRMGLQQTGRIADYLALLRHQPEEVERLWKDLLISVTSFFRDPQAWQFLQEQVIPRLVERKDAGAAVRMWVPACATGEEAYSLAMLLIDQLRATEKNCPIQIFASDVDTDALEFARAGVYPENIGLDVPEDRLRRFFVRGEHGYRVSSELREAVAFAPQNLVSDPPFSQLDLISCRNLLIYIEPDAQQKIIRLLHFALAEGGYLFLGSAETIGGEDDLFQTLSKKWRIYRRIGPTRHDRVQFPIAAAPGRSHALGPQRPLPARIAAQTQQLLLERYAPACVVINRNLEIQYFHGSTQEYLVQPTGLPTQELLAQARGGLQTKLRSAVGQATRENRRVTVSGVFIQRGKVSHRVRVTVEPLRASKEMERLLLVSFEDEPETPAPRSAATRRAVGQKGPDKSLVRQLEDELKATREDLRSTIGDLETSNEELRAANEEMMSANEELQSTNEELETSKEELQSLNEELTTVNAELAGKIGELADTCDDLDNLLVSTNIPTIFLDTQLCIRRFTPSATKLFNLIPSDVGRPMADITPRFEDGDLLSDARTVLNQPTSIEKEVQAHDGRWHIRQVLPYRARDTRVEGIVITFSDLAAEALQEARLYAETIVNTVREPLLVLDADLRVRSANQTFYETFQLSKSETEGRLLAELGNRQLDILELQAQLREILSEKKSLTDFAIEIPFAGGEARDMVLNAHCLSRGGNRPQLILLAFEDISEHNRAAAEIQALNAILEQRVEERTAELQAANKELDSFSYSVSHDLRAPLRHMEGFAALLLTKHAGQLDAQGQHYLQLVQEAAVNMSRLVDDLLSLSRLARAEMHRQEVNLSAMTQAVAAELQATNPGRAVEFVIAPGVRGRGDPHLLRVVLDNLLGNAWKYTSKHGTARIEFGCMEKEGQPAYFVRDDGAGFDMAYVGKLFGAFQRLHAADDFEGTGIGLATVQRIIHRHVGQVWAEGAVEQGATFYFTLSPPPAQPPAAALRNVTVSPSAS